MIDRPYILESYIIDIFLLSFSRPSIYAHPSIFPFLYGKKISVATTIGWIHPIVTGSLDFDNTKQ